MKKKSKCLIKVYEPFSKDLKNEKKVKKNHKKTKLVKIAIPFWIMKNLVQSSTCISIFPKIIKKNKIINSKNFSSVCLFSVFIVFKNFKFFNYSNFLKNTLTTKVSISIELIFRPSLKTFFEENTQPYNKICTYEKNLFEAIFFSKQQILKWKKNCLHNF